jgi:hypothetical protein
VISVPPGAQPLRRPGVGSGCSAKPVRAGSKVRFREERENDVVAAAAVGLRLRHGRVRAGRRRIEPDDGASAEPGARSVAIGRGRSAAAAEAVTAFARRWEASGATVLTVVTWPEEAASWLRQATRFAAADPDLWIMAGTPRGWAQMTRRLLWSTPWHPGRTLAFAALGTRRAIGLVGAHNLQGLVGATADGGTWTVCNGGIQVAPRDTETTT